MIDIIVNGDKKSVATDTTVDALIASLNLSSRAVIVEVSGEVLRKDQYAATTLRAGDKIELIQFVGGG